MEPKAESLNGSENDPREMVPSGILGGCLQLPSNKTTRNGWLVRWLIVWKVGLLDGWTVE